MDADTVSAVNTHEKILEKFKNEKTPVLKAAAVLYLIPMVLFFLGYFVGDALWGMGTLVGCLSFAAGIILAVVYDRRIGKSDQTGYTITGFVEKSFLNSK